MVADTGVEVTYRTITYVLYNLVTSNNQLFVGLNHIGTFIIDLWETKI